MGLRKKAERIRELENREGLRDKAEYLRHVYTEEKEQVEQEETQDKNPYQQTD